MKKLLLILFINYLLYTNTYTASILSDISQKLDTEKYNAKSILIFIDDSEDGYDANTIDLICAIGQKAHPIIASTNLIYNIFRYYNNDEKEYFKKTDSQLQLLFSRIVTNQYEKLHTAMKAANFNFDDWTIAIDQKKYFYILLPKEKSLDYTNKTTNKKLGLNISDMTLIESVDKLKIEKGIYYRNTWEQVDALESIFCKNKIYDSQEKQPAWSIFMAGHGTMNLTIAGLTLETFKNLLAFFKSEINTRLLIYISCYASGKNNKIIYESNNEKLKFPFAIITQVITDAVAVTKAINGIKINSNGKLEIDYNLNFEKFLQDMRNPIINYKETVKNITQLIPEVKETYQHYEEPAIWGNIVQIRFPEKTEFETLNDIVSTKESTVPVMWPIPVMQASDKKTVDITDKLVIELINKHEKNLNIENILKIEDPNVILLYSKYIPLNLIITNNNMQAIISMIAGDCVQIINNITADKYNINTILSWFRKVKNLDPRKLFYIKSIISKSGQINDIIIFNDKTPGKPEDEKYIFDIFFMKDSTLYSYNSCVESSETRKQQKVDFTFTQVTDSALSAKYERLLKEAKEEATILSAKNLNAENSMINLAVSLSILK